MRQKVKGFVKPIARLTVVILLMIITFSYAMFQGGFVSWFLFYTLLPFLLYSFILFFVPIRIKDVKREVVPKKLSKGDTAIVTVYFKNPSWFPIIFLTVKERGLHPYIEDNYSSIFFVGWRREFQWTYEIPNLKRGEIKLTSLQFTVNDCFGWIVKQMDLEVNDTLIVYPKTYDIPYRQIQSYFAQGGVLETNRLLKDTSMVTGIREYQSGDKFSWIHWKSFAKNETLRSKDFEEQQSQEILLVVDGTGNKNFEEVIELSASILKSVATNYGEISYFFARGEGKYIPQIKNQVQLAEVMQHLAVVKADESAQTLQLLTSEIIRMNPTVLIITGEITKALERLMIEQSKWMREIYCFVVTEDESSIKGITKPSYNVKIIPITKAKFPKVFTEVMKP